MLIIPAIDIRDKQCVRLCQGKMAEVEVFSEDPVAMALRWQKEGAQLLHVVDLDGALKGRPVNQLVIKRILEKTDIAIQVGGGIRNEATIREYLEWGVTRVVLGTFLLHQERARIQEMVRKFGNRLIAGVDVKNNGIAIQGWVREVSQPVEQFMDYLLDLGFQKIILTDVERDGMLKGPNIELIKKILLKGKKSKLKVIASGGISVKEDLYQLQKLEDLGLEGVIIGKALYRGDFILEEIIRIFNNGKGK
jgi:phosphoribosylformimino-5-aminoimidazole carboxamide ribotide isomerase